MGYTKKVIEGISWISTIRVITRVLSLGKTVVIARVLSPHDFGLFGIATLVLTFVEIFTETGINIFLIQQKESVDKYINTAWVVSIIRGALIALIIASTTPFVAYFFKAPDAVPLLLLVSLVPLIRGFINPAVIKFQKELKFKKEFYYRTSVFLLEVLVSSVLVVITNNIMGLIWGLLISVVFEVYLSFRLISPQPVFVFHKELFKNIIQYGKWITASTVFNYFYQHGDDIVVGRLLGTGPLGIYDMAYRISLVPLNDISDVVARVTFPVYVRIADDKKRFRKAFFTSLGAICCLTVPIGFILFFYSQEIVLLLLGEKWTAVVPLLKVLAVFSVVRAVSSFSSYVFLSVGKQRIYTLITFIGLVGLLSTIVPSIMYFGIVGAAVAALIGTSLTIPFILYYSYKFLYEQKAA